MYIRKDSWCENRVLYMAWLKIKACVLGGKLFYSVSCTESERTLLVLSLPTSDIIHGFLFLGKLILHVVVFSTLLRAICLAKDLIHGFLKFEVLGWVHTGWSSEKVRSLLSGSWNLTYSAAKMMNKWIFVNADSMIASSNAKSTWGTTLSRESQSKSQLMETVMQSSQRLSGLLNEGLWLN